MPLKLLEALATTLFKTRYPLFISPIIVNIRIVFKIGSFTFVMYISIGHIFIKLKLYFGRDYWYDFS